MIWYETWYDTSLHTTDRQRRVVRNEWTMCSVDVHIMRMCTCKLITNWICTCFCAAMLKDTWPEARKAFQSKDGTLVPLFGSLCLINSSERAWTWVRNQKTDFWMKNHNIIMLRYLVVYFCSYCDKIIIVIHQYIRVSLQHYTCTCRSVSQFSPEITKRKTLADWA